MKQVIMAFSRDYGIDAVDQLKAVQQWSNLRNILIYCGVDVITLPRLPRNSPMSMFVGRTGIILGNTFIQGTSKLKEDHEANEFIAEWLSSKRYTVDRQLDKCWEDFHRTDLCYDSIKKIIWINQKGNILPNFNVPMHELVITDPYFKSLSSCFCPLESGGCLYFRGAFDQTSANLIDIAYGDSAIAVDESDAVNYACSSISIGKSLVTPVLSSPLVELLNLHNLIILQIDIREYLVSGAGCKDLVLETNK